ncbi:CpsD/CapB family tyrosine-protein kinase [Carnobacteriaceae bacterium zg-ZUI252]|nr:CpsD/CapB family tyrosine-protein kinase [Carnobacteriaceae bacterium zg-ZUI252]MBS4770046.1 CpsD/CapB family tyrosine-protein kinase [Carnobacteriaceae bacterium zg-ZUI240]
MFKSRAKKRQSLEKKRANGVPLVAHIQPKSVYAEQYRNIRTNLSFLNLEGQLKTLTVTSSIPGEGKSTVSINLAYVLAATGKRVVIVDADMRKPIVHKSFNIQNTKGLSTLFAHPDVNVVDAVHYEPKLNLYVLPSGPIPPNPSEMLSSSRMNVIIDDLKRHFDIVIFDVPPVGIISDAIIVSTKTDGTVLVVRQDYVTKKEVLHSKQTLENVGAKLLGYVMNDQELDNDSDYVYYGE